MIRSFILAAALLHAQPQEIALTKPLQSESSPLGEVALFENPTFGRVLAVKGAVQMTEGDAAVAAEMMAHVPLFAHGKASSVLILGGGDGALLGEVLKHADIARIVVVEENTALTTMAKAHFGVAASAFKDARVELIAENPAMYVQREPNRFDVILCQAECPSSAEFYAHCKKLLARGGIVVSRLGFPFLEKGVLGTAQASQKPSFKHTKFYTIANPSTLGGPLAFSMSSNKKYRTSEKVLRERASKLATPLTYYTPALHRAAFALPAFMQKDLDKQ